MTDLITVVNSATFLAHKDSSVITDSKGKYDGLFKNYACFSVSLTPTFTPIQRPTIEHIKPQQKHNRRKEHDNRSRKKKDINLVIRGLLNVINKSNYQKMVNKIRLIKSETNIGTIFNEILHVCTVQSYFIDIFIQLIFDIIDVCTDGEKKIAAQALNAFVNSIVSEKRWMNRYIMDPNKTGSDYDVFCDFVKNKKRVLAEHTMILRFQSFPCAVVDVQKYADTLVKDLDTCLDMKDEPQCILILQMLIYFAKMPRPIILVDIPDLLSKTFTKKLQFVVEELKHTLSHRAAKGAND
jgi:hypothetical protein